MKGVNDYEAAFTEKEIALAKYKAAEGHKRRMNFLISLAFILLIVTSESLPSADHLGIIIAGYTAVWILLIFGMEWFWYRRNVSEELYATEGHIQRMKEYRLHNGIWMLQFGAFLCLVYDVATVDKNRLLLTFARSFLWTTLSVARLSY